MSGVFAAQAGDGGAVFAYQQPYSPGSGTGATAAEIWAYEIAPGLSARQALLDLWNDRHTPADVADAVWAHTLGARVARQVAKLFGLS